MFSYFPLQGCSGLWIQLDLQQVNHTEAVQSLSYWLTYMTSSLTSSPSAVAVPHHQLTAATPGAGWENDLGSTVFGKLKASYPKQR